ncbi:MAG: hypothetical protein SAJ37_02550 [Oscillatoria sp. PMC 1068.18]|nr:hypothetical protein [Oscillatoria sp. PMC 1076.18]MEC4987602.1 hypothetical protein [Oscillatoria sp. PMC 1068.18]
MESISVLNVLFIAAIALLLIVSGGIAYLTAAEWRDRRRQKRDEKIR